MGHLKIHEAAVGVPARQPLANVFVDFALVVLAVLEPPEPLGPRGHVLHHGLVVEALVAVDDHLPDGDAGAFLHVEHEPHAVRVLRDLERLHLRRVVSGALVERVDGGPALLHGVPVDRPRLRLTLTRPLTSPSDSFSTPRTAHFRSTGRSLTLSARIELVAGGALLGDDVVELAGAEEGGHGALDVAVVDGLMDDEARGPDDLGGGEPGIPLDGDAVDGGRVSVSWAMSTRRRPQRARATAATNDGSRCIRTEWKVSAPARVGRRLAGSTPGSRSAPGTPAARHRARRPLRSRRLGRNHP